MQLIGKLYRANGGWQADWVFVDNGRELHKWTSKDANAMRAMAAGADGAADALVKRYAKAGVATGQAGTYRVVVPGIISADDDQRLAAGLRDVPVVRNVTPLQRPGSVRLLSLDAHGRPWPGRWAIPACTSTVAPTASAACKAAWTCTRSSPPAATPAPARSTPRRT
ncbi:hypothetical protein G6F40_015572 [Rhizopus arrhizus]|nr:hypothetical protein G6F40_015572 [Rhizopus arrhizus]